MNIWNPQPVMPGQRLLYRLPPCDLWIKRTRDECHTGLVTPAPLAFKNAIERPESDPPKPIELIIAKNRHGPTGVVNLMFEESRTRFVETTGRRER